MEKKYHGPTSKPFTSKSQLTSHVAFNFSAGPDGNQSIFLPVNTCRTAQNLLHPVDDPKKIGCENVATPSAAAMTEEIGEVCFSRRGENPPQIISSMTSALDAAVTTKDEEKASASRGLSNKGHEMDLFATVTKVSEIAGHAIDMALEKLDERVIIMAEQTIIGTLENCDSDYNKVFVRRAIWSAQRDLLASILKDDTKICVAFETGVDQFGQTSRIAGKGEKVLVSEPAIPAPFGTYVVKTADKAVCQAAKP